MTTFKLTAQDRKDLEDLLVEAIPTAERQRLQALLWRDDGESAERIADRLKVSRQTVYNWCHRFVAKEGQSLKTRLADAPRKGRPRIGGGRIGILIAPLFDADPHKWGYDSTQWSLTLLCHYLKEQHGIVASGKTVRRAVDRLRIPWKSSFARARSERRLDAVPSQSDDEPLPPPSPAAELEP